MQHPSPTEPDPKACPRRAAGPRFGTNSRGEVAIEYGLIASLIVLALIAVLPLFGNAAGQMYNKIGNAMANSGP